MLLRFNTSVAGERYNYNRTLQGQNPVEVPDARAREFIAAGWAVEANANEPAVASPSVAVADKPQPVQARRR